jgi:hypothetical protein
LSTSKFQFAQGEHVKKTIARALSEVPKFVSEKKSDIAQPFKDNSIE